jgi:hypothetical protein
MVDWFSAERPAWFAFLALGALAFVVRKMQYTDATTQYGHGAAKFLAWVFCLEVLFEVVAQAVAGNAEGIRVLLIAWGAGQMGLLLFVMGCEAGQKRGALAHSLAAQVEARAPVGKSHPVAPPAALREVAWMPRWIAAPAELTAVTLPPGEVDEGQWWDALSERVRKMALAAGPQATYRACRALGSDVAWTSVPHEAGQCLVEGNLNLRTRLRLAATQDGFPAVVNGSDADALAAVEQTELEGWAELARAQVSATNLD